MIKKVANGFFALLCILVGLYPFVYFFIDKKFGLLSSKSNAIIESTVWNIAFYLHIVLGGIALLIGWIQFNKKIRNKHLNFHRIIGRIYVASALLSALSGIYLGFYAVGGMVASIGFICLGVVWFYTTLSAFINVKNGKVVQHQKMMIYSYATCFAAVTLRIWLPILAFGLRDFVLGYQIVAWLCWVPNLIVAFYIVRSKKVSTKKFKE